MCIRDSRQTDREHLSFSLFRSYENTRTISMKVGKGRVRRRKGGRKREHLSFSSFRSYRNTATISVRVGRGRERRREGGRKS